MMTNSPINDLMAAEAMLDLLRLAVEKDFAGDRRIEPVEAAANGRWGLTASAHFLYKPVMLMLLRSKASNRVLTAQVYWKYGMDFIESSHAQQALDTAR